MSSIHNFLKAAEGWLELGDFGYAMEELDRSPAEARAIATVLRLRWQIYAKARRWSDALEIAEGTLQRYPKNLEHRFNYVWSLHKCGKSAETAHYIAIMVEQATRPHFPHSWQNSYKIVSGLQSRRVGLRWKGADCGVRTSR